MLVISLFSLFFQTFCEMVVNEGQVVCVELVGWNPILNKSKVLFLGSIKYEALKQVYDTRVKIYFSKNSTIDGVF